MRKENRGNGQDSFSLLYGLKIVLNSFFTLILLSVDYCKKIVMII